MKDMIKLGVVDKLEKFDINTIDTCLKDTKYDLVYINYDNKDGVKCLKNIYDLSEEERNNFYRMIIFNNDFMMTIYKFSDDDYRCNVISEKDFDEKENIYIKKVYLSDKYKKVGKKLCVRIGKLAGEDKSSFQFIGFEGGEK